MQTHLMYLYQIWNDALKVLHLIRANNIEQATHCVHLNNRLEITSTLLNCTIENGHGPPVILNSSVIRTYGEYSILNIGEYSI